VPSQSLERETLEQLRRQETELEREIDAARRDAKAIVEGAHREAEAISSTARLDAEREVERLRAAIAEELDVALATAKAEVRGQADLLRRRAEQNRERAVARAIGLVTGEPP
jgi:F0F1-type ATP synthase membrane subunit b/b'